MPRPKVGTVAYVEPKPGEPFGHWAARITTADGKRPWIHLTELDGKTPKREPKNDETEKAARAVAAKWSDRAARDGVGVAAHTETVSAAPAGETFDAWAVRWCASREAAGLSTVDDNRSTLRTWISPTLGPREMTSIVKRDLEVLVQHLDAAVRRDELAWKTAANAWGLVSKAFDDAAEAKDLSLRVLASNPATGVRGPDTGVTKAKVYLYPSEALQFFTAEVVPLRWRLLAAIGVYLYARSGELRGLDWEDVDLEHRIVHLHRAEDDAGNVSALKSKEARRVPLEPALVPLLVAMRARAGGKGRVFKNVRGERVPNEEDLAAGLRKWLERAGVSRAELFSSSKTSRCLRFHDLRATGITWRAVRGDEPMKIMAAAGHKNIGTTMLYVREAEPLRDGFGDVFPSLATLVDSVVDGESAENRLDDSDTDSQTKEVTAYSWRSQRELNRLDCDGSPENKADRAAPSTRAPCDTVAKPADPGSRDESGDASDRLDAALVAALEEATSARRWDVVAQIVAELQARRLEASPNVVQLRRGGAS